MLFVALHPSCTPRLQYLPISFLANIPLPSEGYNTVSVRSTRAGAFARNTQIILPEWPRWPKGKINTSINNFHPTGRTGLVRPNSPELPNFLTNLSRRFQAVCSVFFYIFVPSTDTDHLHPWMTISTFIPPPPRSASSFQWLWNR